MTTFFPIALIAGSILIYQIAQKLLPQAINPWHALIMYYVGALGITLVIAFFDRSSGPFLDSLRNANWAVVAVTISIVGIEVGWILAFRSGSALSLTGLIVNAVVAIVVIPIGLIFFKEKLSLVNMAGIALSLLGLVLISQK
jgi:drug/metabolite transporter (DMT)-like permease